MSNFLLHHTKSQRGIALPVGLMMLAMLTVLGVSSMQTTNLQSRMANNVQLQDSAFQAAEAALRFGETRILNAPGTFGTTNGWYSVNTGPDNAFVDLDWNDSDSVEFANWSGSDPKPRFIVEEQPDLPSNTQNSMKVVGYGETKATEKTYRIVSRGWSQDGQTSVILESYMAPN